MTAADEWAEDLDDSEEGVWEPDYDDPDNDWEPDPEDREIARAYEEHAEHCETVHGGGECDCGPSLAARAWQLARGIGNWLASPWRRLKAATRHPWTLRIGPAEITLRLRADRKCGACGGKGWFYTMSGAERDPIPPGYNGAALCGCGSAIASLAESRRYVRGFDHQPPF